MKKEKRKDDKNDSLGDRKRRDAKERKKKK